MRQEEKTELTRERILQAAMQEFGTNGYAATKVNAICGVGAGRSRPYFVGSI